MWGRIRKEMQYTSTHLLSMIHRLVAPRAQHSFHWERSPWRPAVTSYIRTNRLAARAPRPAWSQHSSSSACPSRRCSEGTLHYYPRRTRRVHRRTVESGIRGVGGGVPGPQWCGDWAGERRVERGGAVYRLPGCRRVGWRVGGPSRKSVCCSSFCRRAIFIPVVIVSESTNKRANT